uniref:CCHC-type domain-containing protein n=1 Tax=Aegilops tauschii subsp. strangulata TaxID=200361 RepID=A0A453EP55_AEGTS
MAYYSDHQAYASNTTNSTESIQELISKISHRLDDLARQQDVVFEDRPSSYDPYSRGHPYVAPTCHICGLQGHSPAECQRGYSHPPDCFGMTFAQQHGSCQNNYSYGWPENQNMSYRSNNPEISSFASSYPMQGFRYEEESNNYAPQQLYSPPTHIPQHQEMLPMELNGPPFGQPTPSTQVPTQDDFDDIDKLTLLNLEFTWSAEDDPIRKVILEEMKKIKSGKELVEEVRKIEKNINAGCTISSLLELSVSGISLEVCEVPTPSHPAEQDSKSPEEERPQIEEVILEDKEQDDPELEQQSDQVEDSSSITLEEAKEVDVIEDEEPEIHLPIIIQERDIAGLSNPLDDMRLYELFATTLHYMIPSLKIDLKTHMLGYDDTYTVGGIALIYDDDTYSPHARLMLNGKYHPHVSIELADSYHTRHILYSYAYIIGYSIDDLEGIYPITCSRCLCESYCRFLLVHDPLHADQVRDDIPWDPGGPMVW